MRYRNTSLDFPIGDEDSLLALQAASGNYRIAGGKDCVKKVIIFKTMVI